MSFGGSVLAMITTLKNNARVYVYQCLDEGINCHIAERMLKELKSNFMGSTEVQDLLKMYYKEK